jgi:hypothetical protein
MFCQQSADFYSLSHLYVEVNASHSTARLVRYNVIGCIGAIMAGSCLKALFMTIYTDHRPGQDAEWS